MEIRLSGASTGANLSKTIQKIIHQELTRELKSRAVRASNVLLQSERKVLTGERSGRVYKVPGTHGKSRSKTTRQLLRESDASKAYGHKLRGGRLYRASAPGEPPANRLGMLRLSWTPMPVRVRSNQFNAGIYTGNPYAKKLEEGTRRMAPRPYAQRILDAARPQIMQIYQEPYFKQWRGDS